MCTNVDCSQRCYPYDQKCTISENWFKIVMHHIIYRIDVNFFPWQVLFSSINIITIFEFNIDICLLSNYVGTYNRLQQLRLLTNDSYFTVLRFRISQHPAYYTLFVRWHTMCRITHCEFRPCSSVTDNDVREIRYLFGERDGWIIIITCRNA